MSSATAAACPRQPAPGQPGGFDIHLDDEYVQCLGPADPADQYEGVAFAKSGNLIAVAAAGANAILLFRRGRDGRFEKAPFRRLAGGRHGLEFPHGVAFGTIGNRELLAAVERRGVISIWAQHADGGYADEPVARLHGPFAAMAHADGIAFVPSYPDFLAVCNYSSDTINFYRLNPGAASHFAVQPQVIFTSPYLRGPDGIAFSACGMLATANHSTDTLSIFRQVHGVAACAAPIYDPMPIAVIRDSTLRYPHSVAFCPETNHLAVTNSGSPYVNVYAATGTTPQADWSQACAATIPFVPPSVFEPINSANEQEGGPKGVAVSAREIAVCSPQMGIRVYAYGAARPMSL